MKFARTWISPMLILVLVGCASATVPAISAEKLTSPKLEYLEPRELSLRVMDQREIPAEDRKATENNVIIALRQVLELGGVKVKNDARNELTIRLAYPEHAPPDMERESCVEYAVKLKGQGQPIEAVGVSCAWIEHVTGISYGNDVSTAFGLAMNRILLDLDGRGQALAALSEAPRFEASELVVPDFLKVSMLTLEVVDSWSEDDQVGRNLKEELKKALQGANVEVSDGHTHRLSIKVSKPSAGVGGRAPGSCIKIEANAKLPKGFVSGSNTGCQGQNEKVHHQVLNNVLRLMNEQHQSLTAAR